MRKLLSGTNTSQGNKNNIIYLSNLFKNNNEILEIELYSIAFTYISKPKLEYILKKAMIKGETLNLDVGYKKESLKSGENGISEILIELFENSRIRRTFHSWVSKELLKACKPKISKRKNDPYVKKIEEICKNFKLSKVEKEILIGAVYYKVDSWYEKIFDYLVETKKSKEYGFNRINIQLLSRLTNFSPLEYRIASKSNSKLYKLEFIDNDGDIAEELLNFIMGHSNDPISKRYFTKFKGKTIPLRKSVVATKEIELLKELIRNNKKGESLNILLYGKPGTGKTEFARAILQYLKYVISEISVEDSGLNRADGKFRYRALFACQNIMDQKENAIIIDEADEMLNSESYGFFGDSIDNNKKANINVTLDNTKNPIIWVTNQFELISESTKRRFDFSIEFKELELVQRKHIWKTSISKHKLVSAFSKEQLETLANKYKVSAGGINNTLKNLNKTNYNKKNIMETMDLLLKPHLKLLNIEKKNENLNKANSKSYNPKCLNVQDGIKKPLTILKKFNNHWGKGQYSQIKNMNILLTGPPGTGKTEFAKYLSRELNRDLVIKRASDLQDMYVGNTEKLIREAFDVAEQKESILFIDEAEGLFGQRETGSKSWEVTQANELLVSMEDFKGILICSTNFKKGLDFAFIRRFNIKMEFDYLNNNGKLIMFKSQFKDIANSKINKETIIELNNMPSLTPGDFKVVYQKHIFLEKEDNTNSKLIESLRNEVSAKGNVISKRIGF